MIYARESFLSELQRSGARRVYIYLHYYGNTVRNTSNLLLYTRLIHLVTNFVTEVNF